MYTSSPQYVQFYPTLKCNLSCSFCFNRGIPAVTEMSLNDFERFVSIITDSGIKEIDVLGGEPTLHFGFLQMIDLVKKHKLKTTISSNGSTIHMLRKLPRENNGDQIRIGVSINSDSIPEGVHEYIREYQPIVKSVCLRERTIPEAAREYLGRSGIEYYLLFMDTLYEKDLEKSLPFYEFYRRLNDLMAVYNNVDGVFCSGFVPDTGNHPVLEYVRCLAGTTKLAILPDGSVYPCYLFFRNEEFSLGNILVDDFDRIWKNPILDFFRKFEKNTCSNPECELFSRCHGGCPAVSFLIHGDINAPDPRCISYER